MGTKKINIESKPQRASYHFILHPLAFKELGTGNIWSFSIELLLELSKLANPQLRPNEMHRVERFLQCSFAPKISKTSEIACGKAGTYP